MSIWSGESTSKSRKLRSICSNRAAAGLTYEAADRLLADKEIDPPLRQRFRACLEACDFVRFLPEASETGRRVEILDEAADILEQLERAW